MNERQMKFFFTEEPAVCWWLFSTRLQDKPVVFGSLGREPRVKTSPRSVKTAGFGSLLGRDAEFGTGEPARVQIKVLPSIPCGLFGVSSEVQMKMYRLLCFFVPERTRKIRLSDALAFTHEGTSDVSTECLPAL